MPWLIEIYPVKLKLVLGQSQRYLTNFGTMYLYVTPYHSSSVCVERAIDALLMLNPENLVLPTEIRTRISIPQLNHRAMSAYTLSRFLFPIPILPIP